MWWAGWEQKAREVNGTGQPVTHTAPSVTSDPTIGLALLHRRRANELQRGRDE